VTETIKNIITGWEDWDQDQDQDQDLPISVTHMERAVP